MYNNPFGSLRHIRISRYTVSGFLDLPETVYRDIRMCLNDPNGLLYMYPGHYDLAVIDVDSLVIDGLKEFIPPLYHSQSRSVSRGGHLWYRRPRYPGDIKPLRPRTITLDRISYTFDVQYTQFIRVPSAEIPGVLKMIAAWLSESPVHSFPYELLGLCCVKGERDSKWWHYILAQTEQLGSPDLVSQARWYKVAEETGYFVDNSQQDFP